LNTRDDTLALESGAPVENADAFRRALGHFSTGVTIITAEAGGEKAGITANSFNSVSLSPPLILWSVKKTSASWPIFAAARSFAVNVLAVDQAPLAAQFARSGPDKYKDVAWKAGPSGAPLLANVTAQFDCVRRVEYDGGDHLIVVGEVTSFVRYDRRPLIFTQGRFSAAIDSVDVGQPNTAMPADTPLTFLALLRRAFLQRASEFRDEAHSLGFTVNESRLVYHLELGPNLTIEHLARVALLDTDAADDCVAALQAKGWIIRHGDGTLALTTIGAQRYSELGEIARRAEAERLKPFSEAEIQTARKIIAALGGRLDNIPAIQDER
jgi:flavin reductase (DIM6/NTAB) family NADH-FMN oxidoreductase RutF/DNA-binding MarR family transcriptional regulator